MSRMRVPVKFDALARRVDAGSQWPTYTNRKRLIGVGVLSIEFAALLTGAAWAGNRIDRELRLGWWSAGIAAAIIAPMLVQFAFWPRGAIYRTLLLTPLLAVVGLGAMTIHVISS